MRKMLLMVLTVLTVGACDDNPVFAPDLTGEWIGHYTRPDVTAVQPATMEMLHTSGGLLSGTWTEPGPSVATVSGEKAGPDVSLTVRFSDTCAATIDGTIFLRDDHLFLSGAYTADAACDGMTTGNVEMGGPEYVDEDDNVTGVS